MEEMRRGFIEMQLDKQLEEETLHARVLYYNEFKKIGLCNSIENVVFGAIIDSLTLQLAVFEMSSGMELTSEQMREIIDIVTNRSLEIKTKISNASKL